LDELNSVLLEGRMKYYIHLFNTDNEDYNKTPGDVNPITPLPLLPFNADSRPAGPGT
jgi:hypothetical protein